MSSGISLRRHPAFTRYWLGQGVSVAGSRMRELTIQWLVLEMTGSPAWLAAVALTRLGAMLAFLAPAAALVDRLPRRRVILVAESGSLAVSLGLAGLSAAGALSPWLLLVAGVLLGALHAFESPARSVLVHDLVPSQRLLPALSLMSAAHGAARIVGPAVGGLLLARVGATSCFLLDATSYLVLLLAVLSLPAPPAPATGGEVAEGAGAEPGRRRSATGSLASVLSRLLAEPASRLTLVLLAVVAVLAAGYQPLLSVIAQDLLALGAEGFGALQAAAAVGALLAGALLGWIGGAGRESAILRTGALLLPVAVAGMGLARSPWLGAAAVLLAAGSLTAAEAAANASLQLAVPETMRARAVALYTILVHAFPIGGLLLALGAAFLGLRFALLGLAALSLLATLATLARGPTTR